MERDQIKAHGVNRLECGNGGRTAKEAHACTAKGTWKPNGSSSMGPHGQQYRSMSIDHDRQSSTNGKGRGFWFFISCHPAHFYLVVCVLVWWSWSDVWFLSPFCQDRENEKTGTSISTTSPACCPMLLWLNPMTHPNKVWKNSSPTAAAHTFALVFYFLHVLVVDWWFIAYNNPHLNVLVNLVMSCQYSVFSVVGQWVPHIPQ
jgi:hypothetical protein